MTLSMGWPAYRRAVTITYDEPLREQIRAYLASHDRREVSRSVEAARRRRTSACRLRGRQGQG